MRKDEGNIWRKRSKSEEERGGENWPENCGRKGTRNVFLRGDKESGNMRLLTQVMKHQRQKDT